MAKTKYQIIFDTNVLWGNPLKKEVVTFIKDWASSEEVEVEFYIPEVVFQEYEKFFLNSVNGFINSNNGSSGSLRKFMASPIKDISITKRAILNRAIKVLYDKKIKTIPTPYVKIDLSTLINKAVYYLPPFEEKREKGFKDSIIAETVIAYVKSVPKNIQCVFVCGDTNLRSYISNKKIGKLEVFQSIPEFESELKLRLLSISQLFTDRLTNQAKELFYNSDKPEKSLFFQFKIIEKINENFRNLFDEPEKHRIGYLPSLYSGYSPIDESESWSPIENAVFQVSAPIFLKKEDDIYHWETTIVRKQKFERTTQGILISIPGSEQHEYTLEFNVKWNFKLGRNNRVTNPSYENLIHISSFTTDINQYAKVTNIGAPTLFSGVTASGIGTAVIGNQDAPSLTLADYLIKKDK